MDQVENNDLGAPASRLGPERGCPSRSGQEELDEGFSTRSQPPMRFGWDGRALGQTDAPALS